MASILPIITPAKLLRCLLLACEYHLAAYRNSSQTEREKGTYFEELTVTYLRNEAVYKDLYSKIWTYADWAKEQAIESTDTGIDLVALCYQLQLG